MSFYAMTPSNAKKDLSES